MKAPKNPAVPPAGVKLLEALDLQLKYDLGQFDAYYLERFAKVPGAELVTLAKQYTADRFDRLTGYMSRLPAYPGYVSDLKRQQTAALKNLKTILRHIDSVTRNDAITSVTLQLSAKIVRLQSDKNRVAARSLEQHLSEQLANARYTQTAAAASRRLRLHRAEIVKHYRKSEKREMSMQDLARAVGHSSTAIYGMINGDRTRYNADALKGFLKKIGISPEEWNQLS